MARTISLLVAVAVFIAAPVAVQRLTGYGEQPVLRGVAWLLASLALYPAASATYQEHKSRPLPFRYYYALMFGIAVFGMSFEGLLTR